MDERAESRWTKGPWVVTESEDLDNGSFTIVTKELGGAGFPYYIAKTVGGLSVAEEFNARLIAQAPRLADFADRLIAMDDEPFGVVDLQDAINEAREIMADVRGKA